MSDGSYVVEPKLNDTEFISRLEKLSELVKQTMQEVSEVEATAKKSFQKIAEYSKSGFEETQSTVKISLGALSVEVSQRTKEIAEKSKVSFEKIAEVSKVELNKASAHAKSAFGTIGRVAKAGLGVAISAIEKVSSVLFSGLKAGMQYNSDMQGYFTNFEGMLGSASAATDVMTKLKTISSNTPFSMGDLSEASKTLLSFGENAQDLVPDLKTLGNISLGNADKFKSLAEVYGQVKSKGKLMGDDLQQLTSAGFNPLQIMAQKTGKSMSELQSEVEKGQISFNDVKQAMQDASAEGGQFHDAMQQSGQSFQGMISILENNAMALLGDVVKPITDGMTQTLLPGAIGALTQLQSAFESNGVDGLISAGSQILGNLLLGISNAMPDVINMAVSIIQMLCQAFTDNAGSFGEASMSTLYALIEALSEILPEFLNLGLMIFTNLLQGLVGNDDQTMEGITTLLGTMFTGFSEIMAQYLPTILLYGAQILFMLISGIVSGLPLLVQAALDLIVNFVTFLGANMPIILAAGVSLINSLVTGILSSIQSLLDTIPILIGGLVGAIAMNLPSILAAGMSILSNLLGGILQMLPSLITLGANIVGQLVSALVNNLPQIISAAIQIPFLIASTILTHIPDILAVIPNIFTSVSNTFSGIDWGSVGSNIVKGIVSGVTNGAGLLLDSLKGLASKALSGVKEFLGIHSPSKVFKDEVGQYMALGISAGFSDTMDHSVNSSLAQDSFDTIESVKSAMNRSFYTATPSVTNPYSSTFNGKENKTAQIQAQIHVTTNLEGKEVAHAIAPYVSEEIAFA